MDYEETCSPIAKMTTFHTLISVASVRIKTSFLNGDLQEEIYMEPPPGFSHDSRYVCKLKKALYGLQQVPHAWFEKFIVVICSLGFVVSSSDYVLFAECTNALWSYYSFFIC